MSGTSTLTLTQGLLSLGANDLTIASTASISGGSSTSYIRTGGSGALKRTVANSNVSFPGRQQRLQPADAAQQRHIGCILHPRGGRRTAFAQ
jgi:hypothetical protein